MSRVPCRKSIGIVTAKRCSARAVEGLPAGCNGKPRNASPRTPGSGACVCAWIVVKTFLGYVQRHGFALFAWWRVIVGTLGLIALAMGF